MGLILKTVSDQPHAEVTNVTGGFTCLVFFGILVGPGKDLRQDFLNMAYAFCLFYILYFIIIDFLFYESHFYVTCSLYIICQYSSSVWCELLYCFFIYYHSYYTIVRLNVLLLFCISIACATYLILFDFV